MTRFKGKKILIMGLGLHGGGASNAKFFCEQGAEVVVTDLKTKEQLKESVAKLNNFKIKYVLGGHKEEDFLTADIIIKNPDVSNTSPYLKLAKEKGIKIETDISLFFKLSKAFIIGVTGSKGKSTTSALIYNFLKSKYENVFLAGNIGVSPLELLPKIKEGDKVVLELSSFELENLEQSPNIAVITNIYPDHLNRYAGMEDYIEAKKTIFKFQAKDDALFLNEDDSIVRQFSKEAKSKVHFFSGKLINLSKTKLFGNHNKSNIAAATEVAKVLEIPQENIEKVLEDFPGVPSRMEFVAEISGAKYFNDTTATMPNAVEAAILAFFEKYNGSKIILIAGGAGKNLNYKELSDIIKAKVSNLIMLPGNASEKLIEELAGWDSITEVSSMKEAVISAKSAAKQGDIVLLSPGAASFNLFKNEFDRGDQFVKFVKEFGNEKAF